MNIPEPRSVNCADICRDGGTYVVLYLDKIGDFYEVELPVIIDSSSAGWHRIGYKPPIFRGYDPKIQGKIRAERQLSWEEGLAIRKKLVPLLSDNIGMGGRSRAEEMFELILSKGELPRINGVRLD